MSNTSLQEIALRVLRRKRKPFDFTKLWEEVASSLNLTEPEKRARMIRFYNAIHNDSRFIQMPQNQWDLKSRQTYSVSKVDLSAYQQDDDDLEGIDEINDEIFEKYEQNQAPKEK